MGGAGGACSLRPRNACCFSDADCPYRCYGAQCADASEGVCKPMPMLGQCWADRDCAVGATCNGARVCPCGAQCLLPDAPGMCISVMVR
jgi:hypothetical protein